MKGKWANVLSTCSALELPTEILMDMYEELMFELIERGDYELGEQILGESQVLQYMKNSGPAGQIRFKRLQTLLGRDTSSSATDLRQGYSKAERRQQIAKSMRELVITEAPSGLLNLIRLGMMHERNCTPKDH